MNWDGQMGWDLGNKEATISAQGAVVQHASCPATVKVFLSALAKEMFEGGKCEGTVAAGSPGALPEWRSSKGERAKLLGWEQEEQTPRLWWRGQGGSSVWGVGHWAAAWCSGERGPGKVQWNRTAWWQGQPGHVVLTGALALGSSRSGWHLWRWKEGSRDEALQPVYDPTQMGVEFIFLIIVVFSL